MALEKDWTWIIGVQSDQLCSVMDAGSPRPSFILESVPKITFLLWLWKVKLWRMNALFTESARLKLEHAQERAMLQLAVNYMTRLGNLRQWAQREWEIDQDKGKGIVWRHGTSWFAIGTWNNQHFPSRCWYHLAQVKGTFFLSIKEDPVQELRDSIPEIGWWAPKSIWASNLPLSLGVFICETVIGIVRVLCEQ